MNALSLSRNMKSPRIRSSLLSAGLLLTLTSESCTRSLQPGFESAGSATSVAAEKVSPAVPKIPEPYRIQVTGSINGWQVRYPNASGRLETETDVPAVRDIHVPLDANVVIDLKSSDYVYLIAIPHFGLKEIAVPGLEFQIEFRLHEAGQFELIGEELCGEPHSELQGSLIVEPEERFLDWLQTAAGKNVE